LERLNDQPDWDGLEKREAVGRPRDLSPRQEVQISGILLHDVGELVVSATHVKRSLPETRLIPDRTIQRTFTRLGNAYLYRRARAAIGEKYKPARLKYCDWLLKQDQSFLNNFTYVDGTSFFRSPSSQVVSVVTGGQQQSCGTFSSRGLLARPPNP